MPKQKRYENEVRMSVRMPAELRDRAVALVARIKRDSQYQEIPGLACPGCEARVKPSVAVLAIRGLKREIEAIEKELTEIGVNE